MAGVDEDAAFRLLPDTGLDGSYGDDSNSSDAEDFEESQRPELEPNLEVLLRQHYALRRPTRNPRTSTVVATIDMPNNPRSYQPSTCTPNNEWRGTAGASQSQLRGLSIPRTRPCRTTRRTQLQMDVGGVTGQRTPCTPHVEEIIDLSQISKRRSKALKKNGNWTSEELAGAIAWVDAGEKILVASEQFGIPVSTLRCHLDGTIRSRKRGRKGVLTPEEEGELVAYITKMASIGHPLSLVQLRLKVAEMTQERDTPFKGGIPGRSWLRWFRRRNPDLSLRIAQALESSRAKGLCPENVASFYDNLRDVYRDHNYPPSQIWNADESGAQAGRSGGAVVLTKKGLRQVHTITPNDREHLSVLCCVNAAGECLPNFYIFKGKQMRRNYIKKCETGSCMAMQPRAWMTGFLFSKWLSHFVKCVQALGGRLSKDNRHLLILDGHNSHVTMNVVMQARDVGLDLLTLPSHTSHALQPLDISCFKTFKGAFRHCRDVWSLVNKGKGARKEDLAHWVSISLRRALTPVNILAGFKAAGIWPFDDTKMEDKMSPSKCWPRPQSDIPELAPISIQDIEEETLDVRIPEECDNVSHYYVEVDCHDAPSSSIGVESRPLEGEKDFIPNTQLEDAQVIPDYLVLSPPPQASLVSRFLTLPELPESNSRRKRGSEPIIDYSKSILMTSDEYTKQLEEKSSRRADVEEARRKKKEQIELNKGKREAEKMVREEAKKAKIALKESKRAFDAQWSAKRCAEIGELLHQAIKMNAPIRPGTYAGRFCGFAHPLCRENNRIATERLRMKRAGLKESLPELLTVPWAYRPDARFPQNDRECTEN